MTSPQARCLELLAKRRAIFTGDHFVYKAGGHSDTYVNKDAIIAYPGDLAELCAFIAVHFAPMGVEAVLAPATAGIALAQWTAHHLTALSAGQVEVIAVYADKVADSFAIRRGYDNLLRGRRTLVVEDVLTTGSSVRGVIDYADHCGAEIVGVGALVNRGGVTAAGIVVSELFALADIPLGVYRPDACPLCATGVPINTELGHGKAYVAAHGQPTARS